MGNKIHIPVLLQEVVRMLEPKPADVFIDSTLGFGGHTQTILELIGSQGTALGVDQDEEAISYVKKNLCPKFPNLTVQQGNFQDIEMIAKRNGINNADMVLADLGFSSFQIDSKSRGFSFMGGPLDMRMDKSSSLTAESVINRYPEKDLVRIFQIYGEERLSKTIAHELVTLRSRESFRTTSQLAETVANLYRERGIRTKMHPATKVFQALRIEVNHELDSLEIFLPKALSLLAPGGRLMIITFHSLEDRRVKDFFKKESSDCICPPEIPVCVCSHKKSIKLITRKPIIATQEEKDQNPRARSAKARVVEKI